MIACACGCGAEVATWRLAERCGHLLAGACLGKKRWPQRYAQKILALPGVGDGKQAYRCPVCGQWHVGADLGEHGERINAERAAIVRRLRERGNGWLLTWLAGEFEAADRIAWKTRAWKAER